MVDIKENLSNNDIANILGISKRHVKRLVKNNVLFKDDNGNYDLPKSVQSYISYKNNNPENKDSALDIANILGISKRHVRRLAGNNVLFREGKGKYNIPKSVQGYIAYSIEKERAIVDADSEIKSDLVAEQTKLIKHKAEIERMKELEMKGLLVNKAAEIQYGFKLARITRNNILNLPAQLAITLAAETDADKVYRSLKNALVESLTEIADLAEQAEQQQNAEWPHETECYHWHWSN